MPLLVFVFRDYGVLNCGLKSSVHLNRQHFEHIQEMCTRFKEIRGFLCLLEEVEE